MRSVPVICIRPVGPAWCRAFVVRRLDTGEVLRCTFDPAVVAAFLMNPTEASERCVER